MIIVVQSGKAFSGDSVNLSKRPAEQPVIPISGGTQSRPRRWEDHRLPPPDIIYWILHIFFPVSTEESCRK